jgi:predicted nucleic acid-binding protein
LNGVDSSILVYASDPTTIEHVRARESVLSMQRWALNPTVVHEVYHTLVFKRGMSPKDAKLKLVALVKDSRTLFLNLTKTISLYSLELGSLFNLGGRDSLIVGCYLRNGMEEMLTHDKKLLQLKKLSFKGREITFTDPLLT